MERIEFIEEQYEHLSDVDLRRLVRSIQAELAIRFKTHGEVKDAKSS